VTIGTSDGVHGELHALASFSLLFVFEQAGKITVDMLVTVRQASDNDATGQT
jgi:hypothetical protein